MNSEIVHQYKFKSKLQLGKKIQRKKSVKEKEATENGQLGNKGRVWKGAWWSKTYLKAISYVEKESDDVIEAEKS